MERQKIHSERMYKFIPSVVVGRSVVVVGMVELCDVVGILIEPSVVVGSDAFVVCSCVNVVVGSVVVVGSSVVVVVGISVVVEGSGVVVVGISVVTGVVVGSGVVVVGISVVVVGFCVVVGLGVVVVGVVVVGVSVVVVVGVSVVVVVVVVCSTVVVGNVDEVVGSSLSDISKIEGRFNYTHALLLSFCLLAQFQIC